MKNEMELKKDKNSKKQKETLVLLLILLFVVTMGIVALSIYSYKQYLNSFYPKNVIEEDATFPTYMGKDSFSDMNYVSTMCKDQGFGIYTYGNFNQYFYADDVFMQVSTSLGDDTIVTMGKGTGDLKTDIEKYIEYYYSFSGEATGVYIPVVSEEGTFCDYTARYTSGRLTPTNFFRKGDFYIAAMEVDVKPDFKAVWIYSCSDITELTASDTLLRTIIFFMMNGQDSVADSQETDVVDNTLTTDMELELEANVTPIESATVSENTLGVETVSYNKDVDTWVVDYLKKKPDFKELAFMQLFETGEKTKEFGLVSTIDRDGRGEICFVAQVADGTPVHAVLFSPDFKSYYEPTRYNSADGTYYFYVVNPAAGEWRCLIETTNSNANFGVLKWYGITNQYERDNLLRGQQPLDASSLKLEQDEIEEEQDGISLEMN